MVEHVLGFFVDGQAFGLSHPWARIVPRHCRIARVRPLPHSDIGGADPETVDVAVGDGVESARLRQLDAEARGRGRVCGTFVRDRPLAMRAELDLAKLDGEWRTLRGVMQGDPDDVMRNDANRSER